MAADGASGIAAAGLAIKFGWAAKVAAVVGAGTLGALLIAAVDPGEAIADPIKRRRLIFAQVICAAIFAPIMTPITVHWLDSTFSFLGATHGIEEWSEVAMPVGLFWGAMAWGVLGAMVKLRAIVKERGAEALADRVSK
jgi:hypothetical protein